MGTRYRTVREVRDRAVRGALERAGVECESHSGHTLYDVDEMLEKCKGNPPTTYQGSIKIVINGRAEPSDGGGGEDARTVL